MPPTSRIAAILCGPSYKDVETARRAHVLRVILYSALALTLLMAAAVLLFTPSAFDSLIIVLAVLLWELIVILFMLRGYVRAASVLLTSGLCVNALITSYLFGGVQQVTFSTYVIVILTGGILLGKRAALLLSAVGIFGGLAMLYAQLIGRLPLSDSLDAPTTWAAASVTFIWAAVVLYMALKSIEEELERRAEEVRKRRLAQEQITHLHRETEEHIRHVQSLYTIDQAITTSQQLPTVLHILLEQVVSQVHMDAAAVSLLNGDGETLQVGARIGFRSDNLRPPGLGFRDPIASDAMRQQRLLQVPDLSEAESELYGEDFVTYWAAPLIVKSRVKGVLEAFHRSRIEEPADNLEFFQALTTQAAIAVENAMLFEDLQRAYAELTLSYDATIESTARALELRDAETEGHSRRVKDITIMLARRLGLPESELDQVRRGALLHDIGKMAIPDAILLKPGPLDASEWKIMRAHPVYVMLLMSPITFLKPALDIPYCHHEKWDGTGYPRGLRGEKIPLSARIFAIVDVWDAISSDRPYRVAWEREQVREFMLAQTGRHFDPRVFKSFISLLEELHL